MPGGNGGLGEASVSVEIGLLLGVRAGGGGRVGARDVLHEASASVTRANEAQWIAGAQGARLRGGLP